MLRIEHLTKRYGDKTAVDDLTLHIQPGEIYGFIGHNGAGKTTTLKTATGIMQFDAGEIYVGGHSIKAEPIACKKEMAYIPDNPDLYEFMTGIQYLNFIADIFGVDSDTRGRRIHEYASAFELEKSLAMPISSYSHGMKQKLAVISALIHEPKLVIMDEPFVGLDPVASHLLKTYMRDICDNGGAIFFSTHVLEVAEKLCDKVAIIKNGKLIKSGTMDEVRGDDSLEDVFLELANEPDIVPQDRNDSSSGGSGGLGGLFGRSSKDSGPELLGQKKGLFRR
jgi:ABC-2 type transport system ATP-binding protein